MLFVSLRKPTLQLGNDVIVVYSDSEAKYTGNKTH
jgi:hypothetical protein